MTGMHPWPGHFLLKDTHLLPCLLFSLLCSYIWARQKSHTGTGKVAPPAGCAKLSQRPRKRSASCKSLTLQLDSQQLKCLVHLLFKTFAAIYVTLFSLSFWGSCPLLPPSSPSITSDIVVHCRWPPPQLSSGLALPWCPSSSLSCFPQTRTYLFLVVLAVCVAPTGRYEATYMYVDSEEQNWLKFGEIRVLATPTSTYK